VFTLFAAGTTTTTGQNDKKRTGSTTGEVKSQRPTPNGKNVFIEVLAPGEEKARSYRVAYDPKAKGPIAKVLESVKAAKVGDRVQLEWIDSGEGLAITAFEVLKKSEKK
jgi:hypothetical protein